MHAGPGRQRGGQAERAEDEDGHGVVWHSAKRTSGGSSGEGGRRSSSSAAASARVSKGKEQGLSAQCEEMDFKPVDSRTSLDMQELLYPT